LLELLESNKDLPSQMSEDEAKDTLTKKKDDVKGDEKSPFECSS